MTDLPEKDKKRKAETAEYSGLFFLFKWGYFCH